MPQQVQLKFNLQPTSQRVRIEIQKSKYPNAKSGYEFYKLYDPARHNLYGTEELRKELKDLMRKHPGYKFRVRRLTYQTFTKEILAKVEQLKCL